MTRAIRNAAIGWCLVLSAIHCATPAQAQELRVRNTAQYVTGGRWDWTIYIEASAAELDRIRCVDYTLHPTFPNPKRQVCALGNRQQPFALKSNGWGTFEVAVAVRYKNGSVRQLKHMLDFSARSTATGTVPLAAANTAKELKPGLYEWTVYVTGTPEQLGAVQCVEYKLHPTFPKPLQEVCTLGNTSRAFALTATGWGTFVIGIRVRMKDGRIQELSHALRF